MPVYTAMEMSLSLGLGLLRVNEAGTSCLLHFTARHFVNDQQSCLLVCGVRRVIHLHYLQTANIGYM